MTIATLLPRGIQVSRIHHSAVRSYQVGRTSSVNTAIARGIRKSDGFGSSGRRKSPQVGGRDGYRERRDTSEFGSDSRDLEPRGYSSKPWEKRGKDDDFRSGGEKESRSFGGLREDAERRVNRKWDKNDRGNRDAEKYSQFDGERRNGGFRKEEDSKPLSAFAPGKFTRTETKSDGRYVSDRKTTGFGRDEKDQRTAEPSFSKFSRDHKPHFDKSRFSRDEKFPSSRDNTESRGGKAFGHSQETPRSSYPRSPADTRSSPSGNSDTLNIPYNDRNIPLSIPYTTPASEFLYGTSVVLSALTSSRLPRRKLYKLYMLHTPGREDPEQDNKIASLARRAGVTVHRIPTEGVRLLDKMSAGRPHNGYILEASPLPRLPVVSLGEVSQYGFQVVLGHQSREEAEVNGTENFISTQSTSTSLKRNPLVLYLDSITDPGNLGGIIRSASFLGVAAIAISTRNSASFSPIVLKASAGASENMVIFSVDKPAGFIVDSRTAGWKIYAGVAPEKGVERPSVSADKLNDPLHDDPVILMLGSEGEGLRWNLRSKADMDVYIRGSRSRGGVDSLNVSVATGILCNSFLRGPKKKKQATAVGASQTWKDVETPGSLNITDNTDAISAESEKIIETGGSETTQEEFDEDRESLTTDTTRKNENTLF